MVKSIVSSSGEGGRQFEFLNREKDVVFGCGQCSGWSAIFKRSTISRNLKAAEEELAAQYHSHYLQTGHSSMITDKLDISVTTTFHEVNPSVRIKVGA